MTRAVLAALALVLLSGIAEARYRGHGHHGGLHFRTGHCKRASCFRKHPGGTYVYPIGGGRRRYR